MESLRCSVERITFTNEENGYTVLRVKVKGLNGLVTVVGNMGAVTPGTVLSLKGEWKTDVKYGRQFSVSEYEETLPATVYGVEKYLGSGLIKGVGPKFAGRIVKTFGTDTLNVIEEEPERLTEAPGIGKKRADMIKSAWREQKEIKNIMLFLQEHGVGAGFAFKVFKVYGESGISVVKENPFKLTEIHGIGFKTADTVAGKMGFDKESFYRLRSGILYTLNECSNDGHCLMPRGELTKKTAETLGVEESGLSGVIDELLFARDLMLEPPDSLYIPSLYFSETGTAKRLQKLLSGEPYLFGAEAATEKIEQTDGIRFDEIQKEAIRTAVNSKVMILTGGPGTGKTTAIKGIIAVFREAGMKILTAAPTGRAAKRLGEATGTEAKTIHRLLEAKPPDGYRRNEENPLRGDVLIIDESSMIDIVLMYNLLKAVPDEMTVIFTGDADQLPSVGPGNVLRDMIDSGAIPVVRLARVFRQAMGSRIIMNAHRINAGEFPSLKSVGASDFFFVEQEDNAEVPATIVDLCVRRLPKYFGIKPSAIQVLCPMQRGDNGAQNLNALLQNAMNTSPAALSRGGTEYRQGDKVMQIRNNYEKEVFNGDIGRITEVNEEERTLSVSFDGDLPVSYDITELDELVLAYAVTVHQAQ
ncbi:MAG: ATP-dependent RecD-like DNA helicase, partial [Oscillospiraceae bacterium]|nr:ATP-dependent RecD-like DNA helicase [Oscillospiraceae bacterium]